MILKIDHPPSQSAADEVHTWARSKETSDCTVYGYLGEDALPQGVVIPEFIALLIALAIYTAAFIAEAVRSGIIDILRAIGVVDIVQIVRVDGSVSFEANTIDRELWRGLFTIQGGEVP